nr:gtpase-activating protein gyp1 [Quercus suber]
MRNTNNNNNNSPEDQRKKESTLTSLDSRFNQTLRNVQGLLKGRSIPGKILLTRRSDPLDESSVQERTPEYERSLSYNEAGSSDRLAKAAEEEVQSTSKPNNNTNVIKLKTSTSEIENTSKEVQKSAMGARATDSARVMKFTKALSGTTVILEKLRELAWSGIPDYMRPDVWRLLLGYAPPNSDRKEGILRRKRLEYLDCVSQYYDIPDTERSDDEINMLRQIAVDCPRTVPDVSFFQEPQVQKSLERILYTWAIRHPASGYVQGINDLATPFLVVFLSEYLEGGADNWSISDLSLENISNLEADCYWCLSKLLDGMQDHYTFAQPGIQRLVFKLKELVRRIDEPVSRHMEEQGLEFLQFAFRWFNCLLIREIPFHLVTRLWDTYLAEGDALPDFLVYIFASFLLTWSDKLQKLDFQELVMFLQHLPTQNWTHQELEMVLSRAFMWHNRYPDLYRICRSKEASVADLMRYTNGVLHWEIRFCREVHNRELEAFRSFINTIYSIAVRGSGEDKRCWLPYLIGSLAIRHPASGYVQGINDLATPFLVVFLSEYLEGGADNWSISDLSLENISNLEADCYWCLSKLLDGMQDHYTFAQPGIQRLVFKLKELVRRIDEPVSRHMEEQGLEFLQFAFRWFNCLLIREIPFHLVTRLWDTYLAEGDALPDFLVYIFASFLLTWSDKLQKLDFQELVMFLQHLPTQNWTHQELEMVLSRAFMWHSMFNNSPSHLAS